jgi:hypothetical protein
MKYLIIDLSTKGKRVIESSLTLHQALAMTTQNPNLKMIRMGKSKW